MTEQPIPLRDQRWPEGTPPVVSIFCITYNHEKFIRDAIEGFLMQETTFPVEIFVHDDASKDGTQAILKQYQEKYPHLFRMILQKENQWSTRGTGALYDLLQGMRGEYTSLCEGDDFWTDKNKLQKQHDLLKNFPSSVLAGGFAKTLGSKPEYLFGPREHKEAFELRELFDQGIHTSTYFYRTRDMHFPDWVFSGERANGDIIMQTLAAQKGPVRMSPDILSIYRVHSGGVWSGTKASVKIRKNQETWSLLDQHLSGQYSGQIRSAQIKLARSESKRVGVDGMIGEAYRIFFITLKRYFPGQLLEILLWFFAIPTYRFEKLKNRITKRIAFRTRIKKIIKKKSFFSSS